MLVNWRCTGVSSLAAADEGVSDGFTHAAVLTWVWHAHADLCLTAPSSVQSTATAGITWERHTRQIVCSWIAKQSYRHTDTRSHTGGKSRGKCQWVNSALVLSGLPTKTNKQTHVWQTLLHKQPFQRGMRMAQHRNSHNALLHSSEPVNEWKREMTTVRQKRWEGKQDETSRENKRIE